MISDRKGLASFIKKKKITAVKPKVDPVTFYKRRATLFLGWGEVVAFGNDSS